MDSLVQRITFGWDSPRLRDEVADLINGEHLWRGCAGVVVDQFVPDRSVDIVGTIGECRLGCLDSEHDPVGLDVLDVVKHEPCDCHRSQVHQGGWLF